MKNKQIRHQTIARHFGISSNAAKLLLKYSTEDFPISDAEERIPKLLEQIRSTMRKKKKENRDFESVVHSTNFPGYPTTDSRSRKKAEGKNRRLVSNYERFKTSCCDGLGQKRLKLLLNKLAKNGDDVAALYRTALEIESVNVNAKKYFNTRDCPYQDRLYKQKEELLDSFIGQCRQYNEEHPDSPLTFGYENSNEHSTNQIIYFELPDTEQISFHYNITAAQRGTLEKYSKPWDGKVNSTLEKIEAAVMHRYATEIAEYKKHFEEKQKK